MKKEKCSHVVGFTETENYSSYTTEFVNGSDKHSFEELKEKGTLYNFCPYCGSKLTNFVDKAIVKIQKERAEKKAKEEKQKEMAKNQLELDKQKYAIESRLNQLSDSINYLVVHEPTKKTYGKLYLIGGSKNYILECSVNHQKSISDKLVIKTIYKVPTDLEFEKIMLSCGYKKEGEKYIQFSKQEGNKTYSLSLDSSGTVYVTIKTTEEDGGHYNDYDQIQIFRLSGFLNHEVILEEVKLLENVSLF